MDCGEGAQMRMQQFGIQVLALIIVLLVMPTAPLLWLGRDLLAVWLYLEEKRNYLFIVLEVKKILMSQLQWNLGFDIRFTILSDAEHTVLVDEEKYQVVCFPVYHSVPTHGFKFIERNVNEF
ncbi:MAG: hypothetical protein IPI46_00045 [Bacteroidetes bacterium]|nr:hypothetical protein [Bacteroidota bacterium]